MKIVPYDKNWPKIFLSEKELILKTLLDKVIDVHHIGSTSVPNLSAKPIIDIAVLVLSIDDINEYIKQLEKIGYSYRPQQSSVERYFFTKNEASTFHLSLTQPDRFSFWKRQKDFRDYLISHPDTAKEYEKLKISLIEKYPDGRQDYCDGKSEFINNTLKLSDLNTN